MVEEYRRVFANRHQIIITYFIFGCNNYRYIGKSQLHLIYLSIGNIPTWCRNKPDAKQLVGYLPILEAVSSIEKKSYTYKNLVRKTFHKSLHHLLEPIILLEDGVDLSVNNETIWFYSRVFTIISDWPEAASFCLVYKF